MQLIDRSNAGEIAGQNTAIALGTFDGLHVGHQELIKTLKSNAAGLKTMASTFSNIPASFFDNNKRLLFTPEEKTRTFEKLGIDYLFMEPFDEHIANMAPDDFARYLFDTLGAKLLVVGFNYTYGYKAGGNAEHLKSFANRYSARVEIVSAINMLGEPVSSTRVRKALKDGDAELAEKLLDDANITTNKNAIPNDPESPFVTSGLRLGTPAMTSRGFKEDDVKKTVEAIALVIDNPEDEAAMEKARAIVKELTDKYPLHKNFGKDL